MNMWKIAFGLSLAAALGAQSSGEIRGYAWDAEGRPMAEAKITLHGADAKAGRSLITAADGSFDARGLPPGHYELTADAAKRQLATESLTALDLKPGETAHADLTLGMSTTRYGFWVRLGRRLDGLPAKAK
jgi:Carboxypeptidase regulatory-like domain